MNKGSTIDTRSERGDSVENEKKQREGDIAETKTTTDTQHN